MLSALCGRGKSRKLALIGRNAIFFGNTPSKTSHVAKSSSTSLRKSNENNSFQNVFIFPHIGIIRGICRLKIYQTSLTFLAVPAVAVVQPQALFATLFISGFAFCMLFVMGEGFRRVIGRIYYNSKEDSVKISHLTFWGQRRDIVLPREDLVPFSDLSENPTDIYLHVSRYSEPKSNLILSLKFGGIIDHKLFAHIFGTIENVN